MTGPTEDEVAAALLVLERAGWHVKDRTEHGTMTGDLLVHRFAGDGYSDPIHAYRTRSACEPWTLVEEHPAAVEPNTDACARGGCGRPKAEHETGGFCP